MSTHLLDVLDFPKVVISKINSLLTTFFDKIKVKKGKMKWRALEKLCKPIKEGGLDIRDLNEIQISLHMKFAWRLMTVDNL